ncbi:MAG: hypothetical protein ACYS80_14830 [Planctomycetota bacterium]|jgi:hypothetical protein
MRICHAESFALLEDRLHEASGLRMGDSSLAERSLRMTAKLSQIVFLDFSVERSFADA